MNKIEFNLPPVTLTEEELVDLLSTAMADTCGFDWWKYDEKVYEQTHEELVAELKPDTDDSICFEQVLARMIFKGHKLELLEAESDWHWSGHEEGEMLWSFQIRAEGCEPVGGKWYKVGLQEICAGLAKHMVAAGYSTVQQLLEKGDFWDADAVFQYAAYGEVLMG